MKTKEYRYSYYHHDYCTTLGHKDCYIKDYDMKRNHNAERDTALKVIENDAVEQEIQYPSKEGMRQSAN